MYTTMTELANSTLPFINVAFTETELMSYKEDISEFDHYRKVIEVRYSDGSNTFEHSQAWRTGYYLGIESSWPNQVGQWMGPFASDDVVLTDTYVDNVIAASILNAATRHGG